MLREERGLTYYAAAKRHNNRKVNGSRVKEWEESNTTTLASVLAHLDALGAKMTIEWWKNRAKILTCWIKSLSLPCDHITPRNFERVNLSATIKFVTSATPSGVAFLFDALCQLVSNHYLCQQQNNDTKRNNSKLCIIYFFSFVSYNVPKISEWTAIFWKWVLLHFLFRTL